MGHLERAGIGLLCAALARPGPAGAAEGAAEEAFCRYTLERAGAESARLLAPAATGTFGLVHGTETLVGQGVADALLPRAALGLRLDLAEVRRGLLVRRLGLAECARHRLERRVKLASGAAPGVERRAWLAKEAVLAQALPRGQELVAQLERAVGAGDATLLDLHAAVLRLDALREQLAVARQEAAWREGVEPPGPGGLDALLGAWSDAEARITDLEGQVRSTRSWEVALRGGWEQIYRTDGLRPVDARIPFYALVSLTFSPALSWQTRADDRASEARRAWALAGGDDAAQPVIQLRAHLRSTLVRDRTRQADLRLLLADLQRHLAEVDKVGGTRAARVRDILWFEEVRVRAEAAFLDARAEDLDAFLGDGAVAP